MKKLLVLLCILGLLLCGCSPKEAKASDAVVAYLKENKNEFDESKLDDLGLGSLTEQGEDGFDEETLKELLSCIGDYDSVVNSETVDGDTATVNVTITTYDFGLWFENSLSEVFTEAISLAMSGGDSSDEAISELTNKIFKEQTDALKEAGKTKGTTIDIICKKVDGVWTVDEEATGEALSDALSGGLMSSIENMASQFEGFLG